MRVDKQNDSGYGGSMSLPNKLTLVRLAMSPLLFIVFFIPVWTGSLVEASVLVCWALFLTIEVTDILDGHLARKWDQVSDIGKVLDPFADVVSRMTYFICFAAVGIMPIWILTIFLYREIGIGFLRLLMFRRGIAMAANLWGKLKAILYAASGVAGFIIVTLDRLALLPGVLRALAVLALVIFILAAIASVGSFVTYLLAVLKSERAAR